MSIVIQTIEQSSPYLSDIKRLGKRNSATLGFFPEGAFDEHAQRQQIFAAISEDGKLAGYLLYRVSNRTARIVHLCVDEPFLGKGVSKLLVDKLKLDTEDLVGISLKCRRDYDANTLWPHLGFSAQAEMPGRGRSPRNLVYWWYGHGHPTLFDFARTDDGETRVTAAVDANIFYDLFEDNRDGHVESIALRADWLSDSVQLVLSDEINNEINRSNDPLTRKISRERINEFERFHYSNVEAETIAHALELLHPNNVTKLTLTDRSDIRQLAAAAAGGLQFFLTRDGVLLGADFRAEVHEQLGLQILRPSDFIRQIDELRSQREYEPAKLSGTGLQLTLVKSGQESSLIKTFHQKETRLEFQTRFRGFLSDVKTSRSSIVTTTSGDILALVVSVTQSSGRTEIPIFRVLPGNLAPTLTRHLLVNMVDDSVARGSSAIEFTDAFISGESELALKEEGFLNAGTRFLKFHLPVMGTSEQIVKLLSKFEPADDKEKNYLQILSDILAKPPYEISFQTYADIEKALFPLKILDSPVKTYMVPIRPNWAKELFDSDLANQGLFPAREDLALRKEQVYYRSRLNSAGIKPPARVLWYVSQDRSLPHKSGAIRACSTLYEVNVDSPKVLYARYRRLGIYEWSDVYKAAKQNVDNDIMALRFGDTELFPTQITLDDLRNISKQHDFGLQLQSISRIPRSAFAEIYARGLERRYHED